ncbi:MAG: LytR/AlgR family response regulator transcription factor [bacterium]
MFRFAIVEDDDACAEQLQKYLAQYAGENALEIRTDRFYDGLNFAEDYKARWDLIFMDIEMPLLDGMSAARRIREKDDSVLLIFITNMAQYAIQGYEVRALDYILKPVNYYAFAMKLRKVIRILDQRVTKAAIVMDEEGNSRRIALSEVRYIEVLDHQLIYHRSDDTFHTFGSLKKTEQEYGKDFARCNNCYLVNLRYVDGFSGNDVIVAGSRLPVSRARKKDFQQRVADYYRFGVS